MTCPSAADTALELDFGALYFRCRGVLNVGALYFRYRRVLSKAQLGGVQKPDPLVQTGLRIIRSRLRLWLWSGVGVEIRVWIGIRAKFMASGYSTTRGWIVLG